MQQSLEKYSSFYKKIKPNYRLEWDHSLGTVTMYARFKTSRKELSLSLYQAVVLMLFNNEDELPFSDITAQTRIGMSLI